MSGAERVADEIRARGHLGKDEAFTLTLLDVIAERDRLRAELAKAEPVLVAADRVREAYEAMLDGRDVGRLPGWQSRDSLENDR